MRCQSWRPVEVDAKVRSQHTQHMPGDCRVCWKPCWEKVAEGQWRCDECTRAQLEHRFAGVRLALASEPDASLEVLQVLATDTQMPVALAAQARLASMNEVEHDARTMIVTDDHDGWDGDFDSWTTVDEDGTEWLTSDLDDVVDASQDDNKAVVVDDDRENRAVRSVDDVKVGLHDGDVW